MMATACRLLIVAATLCVIVGCGESGESSREHPGAAKGPSTRLYPSPGPGKPCSNATVAVGKDPRALEVTAWCKAIKQAPPVGFILEHFAPGIFKGHPSRDLGDVETVVATGPGVGGSRARCRRLPGGLACSVTAHGPFRLHTVLAVSPKTRCRGKFAVAAFFDACHNRSCVGTPVHTLFFGRPKGCSA